jgi:hypothetical protein
MVSCEAYASQPIHSKRQQESNLEAPLLYTWWLIDVSLVYWVNVVQGRGEPVTRVG